MRPWYFSNTTVRNPYRLQSGLIALAGSFLLGKVKGKINEDAFARLLANTNIVKILRQEQDASDLGRKWRSALSQLGFIVPEAPKSVLQQDIGMVFTVTRNGERLIEAGDNVQSIQEVMLRSLAAYFIPSGLETDYRADYDLFSPLRFVLEILLALNDAGELPRISQLEMANIVQLSSPKTGVPNVVSAIVDMRKQRTTASNKKAFDNREKEKAASAHGYKPGTLFDYQDLSFRYLKSTGLLQNSGRGVAIVPEKKLLIKQLVADKILPANDTQYILKLCEGAHLPTDDKESAILFLDDLLRVAKERHLDFDLTGRILDSAADVSLVRHEIELKISNSKEEEYAAKQCELWEEIVIYMDLIAKKSKGHHKLSTGDEIKVPQAESAAYLEWIIWRAFLAINSLVNRPFDARRFPIDQDFLPVNTAPGGGPDLIFELEDFVLVVEVTLTENSRQEAAEGESVRRHVADIALENPCKIVYGLFIANRIDSNTAETFRIGCWYANNDKKMRLDIIPVTLITFKKFFESLFVSGRIDVTLVLDMLEQCSALRNEHEAPEWKNEIEQTISNFIHC